MSSAPRKPQSWKNTAEPIEVEVPRHRWQSETQSLERGLIYSLERSLRIRLLLLTVGFLAMTGMFVALLLWGPTRTPVITAAATSYAWPLPPNAWAYEDVQGFAALDSKSIDWRDSSSAWQADHRTALRDLRSQIVSAVRLARRSGVLIVYVAAHGCVDDTGQPCIIPAGSSPLEPGQWITLSDLVGLIPANDYSFHTLLVLDCVDEQVNWNAGIIQSTFADRVQEWAQGTKRNDVSIILSATSDQTSLSGPELQASIFGREFRLGLSGAADERPAERAPEAVPPVSEQANSVASVSGNGDGIVSLNELVSYLQRAVNEWSTARRGQSQSPILLSRRTVDLPLTRALGRGEVRRLAASLTGVQLAVAEPTQDEMASLWRSLDSLREREAYRLEPRAWADLEHQLLWLERLSHSGAAYTGQQSRALFTDLQKRLQEAAQRATDPATVGSFAARSQVLSKVPAIRLDPALLPSLAWQDQFAMDAALDTATSRAEVLNRLSEASSAGIEQLLATTGFVGDMQTPNEVNFLGLVRKLNCDQLWSADPTAVRSAMELREQCEQIAVAGDVLGQHLRHRSLNELDSARRQVEDLIFIGPAAGSGDLRELLQVANAASELASDEKQKVEHALSTHARASAQLSYLAAWICSPQTNMSLLPDWPAAEQQDKPNLAATDAALGVDGQLDPQYRERLALQRLSRLSENVHKLGMRLGLMHNDPATAATNVAEIAEQANLVAADLTRLLQLVKDHHRRALARSDTDNANILQIEGLLGLPLLTADERVALYQKLDRHRQNDRPKSEGATGNASGLSGKEAATAALSQLANSKIIPAITRSEPAGDNPSSETYRSRMQRWSTHPIATVLGLSEEAFALVPKVGELDEANDLTAREIDLVDRLNRTVRFCFLKFTSFESEDLNAWISDMGMSLPGEASPVTLREQTAIASTIERLLMPVCPVRPERDATTDCIRVSVRALADWYVERTLQDFYADGKTVTSSPEMLPFFESAAKHLQQAVATLPANKSSGEAAQGLQKRLDALIAFSRSGLRLTISSGVLEPITNQFQYELNAQSVLSADDTSDLLEFWPRGKAAVALENSAGQVALTRNALAVPLPAGGDTVNLGGSQSGDGTTANVQSGSTDGNAAVYFRGHAFRVPLLVGQGILVDFAPSRFDRSEVVLLGNRVQQPSIVFVLDCSWSMGEAMPIEAQLATTQSRLDLAKAHTLRLISELAQRGDARLGVRLFGHRLGWTRPVDPATGIATGKSEVVPQPNYPGSIPDDITPSQDVEAIVPLGRFEPEMVGSLSKTLSSIAPWGQSPLYLSLVEAMADFSVDNAATTKSIVVITDGDNFQFNASRRPGDTERQTTAADVMTSWKAQQIPIYILGVGFQNSDEAGSGRKELMDLAEASGGKFYDVQTGGDLLRALAEQASKATYRVTAAGRSAPTNNAANDDPDEASLNEPLELAVANPGSPQNYRLEYQNVSVDFAVEGGEALELIVSGDGQEIRTPPYEMLLPQAATLANGNDRLTVRVHRPSPQGSSIAFPISFQDPLQPVTPRPKETWIEITPVASSGKPLQRNYIFYDTNYDPKTPVPRQTWLATDWPSSAPAAEVQVWARYSTSPTNASLPLREIGEELSSWANGKSIPGLPNISWKIQVQETSTAWRLHVTEIHDSQSRGVGGVRLAIDGRQLPRRIQRRFDQQSGIAVHTFEYDLESGQALFSSDTARMNVTTREYALNGAYRLQEPIRVDATPSVDLLPIATTPGSLDLR